MKRILFIPLSVILLGLALISCTQYTNIIKGSGNIVQQDFELSSISGIALSIDADVILTRGNLQQVSIEGQQNIINNIEKYIDGDGLWRIGYYNPVGNHAGITIRITCPDIYYASIGGSGNIDGNSIFPDTTSMVILKISGSGNISLDLNAHIIQSDISGSGRISLSGYADEHTANISGSGDIHAFGLKTMNTYIRISGSGSGEVWAEDLLDVTISGSGNVDYVGYPQITANISGSGSIVNRN